MRVLVFFSFILLLTVAFSSPILLNATVSTPTKTPTKHIQLFALQWKNVNTAFMISMWLLLASLAKMVSKHATGLRWFLPESSLLIVVGLVVGFLLKSVGVSVDTFRLGSRDFFLYLLPPIIFEAGYFMPNRAFFKNVDSIILFAVGGTLLNTIAIGLSLLFVAGYGIFSLPFSCFEVLVFSSLISAVDPVAVIAVFHEMHVNDFLFINVFGEALINDGISVVLYKLFSSFIGLANVSPMNYVWGGVWFVLVAVGGVSIGLLFAFIVSFLTKFTVEMKVLAPLFVFLIPYMAYLTAEMTSLSPILAIAVCGMTMKQYVKGNMSTTASNSVKYFIQMLSQCTESVIFMFLGLSSISSSHHWDTYFVVLTILFCLLYRFIGVFIQCSILNAFCYKKFSKIDEFILSYGGLRGAIAFGLASSMPNTIAAKPMFVTTTIAVIYFTVFIQGSTIRPLVNYLKVEKKDEKKLTLTESIYLKYMGHTMSGVEEIAGQKGINSVVDKFERWNAKILAPILMHNQIPQNFDATKILRAYAKITLADAMEVTRPPRKVSREEEEGRATRSLLATFSEMLDLRIEELRRELRNEGELEDDFMSQMNNIAHLRESIAKPPQYPRNIHRRARLRRSQSGL